MNPEIVELSAMKVARFHALSDSPETDAWKLLEAWAGPLGLLDAGSATRIFGFNNPDPSAGSPNYGYEFWITVGGMEPGALEQVECLSSEGGRYVAAPFESNNPYELPDAWMSLVEWAERSGLSRGTHQWLEGHTLAGMPVRIYLPVQ